MLRLSAVLAGVLAAVLPVGAQPCEAPQNLAQALESGREGAFEALGYWFAQRGQPECAVSALTEAVKQTPTSLQSRYNLGVALVEIREFDKAIEHFEAARAMDPRHPQVLAALGTTLLEVGRNVDAERALAPVAQEATADALAMTNYAKALRRLGRSAEARIMLERVLARAPGDKSARSMLAELTEPEISPAALAARAMRRGDFRSAEKAYREYLAGLPGDVPTLVNLGVALLNQGKTVEARDTLTNAVSRDPNHSGAWLTLGIVEHRSARLEEAATAFRKAVSADGKNPVAWFNLGLSLVSLNRFAEAEAALHSATELKPDDPMVVSAYGMAMARQGRYDDAIEVFRRVTDLEPGLAKARLDLAVVLADKGLLREALQECDEAVRLAPDSGVAHLHRGRVLYRMRRYEESLGALAKTGELDGETAESLLLRGMALNRLERFEEANEALSRSIEEAESDAAYEELGWGQLRLGDAKAAVQSLKRALSINPKNSGATVTLVKALYRSGSGDTAVYSSRLRSLKQEESVTARAKTLSNFALAAAEEENWDVAVERLREAVSVCAECPISPTLHKNLGLVLASAGESDSALQELRLASSLDATDPDIQFALQLLERNRLESSAGRN